ncbi:MAG: ABC transporter substrate-binding protein [bacterium]
MVGSRTVILFYIMAFLGCAAGPKGEKRGAISQKTSCVSLVPSITEIIYCLGAESLLKGNTNQCDYPPEAQLVYKVGDFQMPDLERIMALKPTLVFLTLPIHSRLIEKLQEIGVRVYVSEPKDVEGVFAEIESVGVLLSSPERAREVVDSLKERLALLPAFSDMPRVYVEISAAPLMSVGSGIFINDMIHRAGGRNLFEDMPIPYPVVNPEVVANRNPDVVLILYPVLDLDDVKARVGWSNISAVKNGRVYAHLDEDLFFRPGPRVAEGIYLLARLLHPDEF